jgi:hypothetical protein
VGGPVSILKSGELVVRAFIEAGVWALVVISLLLWLTLRRITDVLLTLVPLLVAGAVTLEICVLIELPLNFANIVALPLLLGVGVAFNIFQRADNSDGVRKPVVIESSGYFEHGQAFGALARHDARRGAVVPAGVNGKTARYPGVGRCRRPDRPRKTFDPML